MHTSLLHSTCVCMHAYSVCACTSLARIVHAQLLTRLVAVGKYHAHVYTCIHTQPLSQHLYVHVHVHVCMTYSWRLVRRNRTWLSLLRPAASITMTSSGSAAAADKWTGNFHTPPMSPLVTCSSVVQLDMKKISQVSNPCMESSTKLVCTPPAYIQCTRCIRMVTVLWPFHNYRCLPHIEQ